MKRKTLVLALVLALAAGFGCAKKRAPEPAFEEVHAPAPAPAVNQEAIQEISSARILFGVGKSRITPEYAPVLDRVAGAMQRADNVRVRIEGRCDASASRAFNLDLGERRAHSAYEGLVGRGVSPTRLEMVSYGKECMDAGSQAQNRRVDFKPIMQ